MEINMLRIGMVAVFVLMVCLAVLVSVHVCSYVCAFWTRPSVFGCRLHGIKRSPYVMFITRSKPETQWA